MPKTKGMLTFLYALFMAPLLAALIFVFYKYNLVFLTPVTVYFVCVLIMMLVNETHEVKFSKKLIQITAGISVAISIVLAVTEYAI